MGTAAFVQKFAQKKVEGWIKEIEKLSKFAETQPHAAYAAFSHGLISKWNYFLRVVNWEMLSPVELLQPLESAIQSQFIPAVTGQHSPGKQVREVLAMPVRLGGLGIRNPVIMAMEQYTVSHQICAPLVDRIVHQDHQLGDCSAVQRSIKSRLNSHKHTQQVEEAKNLQNQLPSPLQRSMELSQEKGASTRLTSLPIDDHGFALHKSAFRDAPASSKFLDPLLLKTGDLLSYASLCIMLCVVCLVCVVWCVEVRFLGFFLFFPLLLG